MTVPGTVPAGAYYVGMIIDATGVIEEAVETNNIARNAQGTVIVPAALAILPVPPSALAPTDPDGDGLLYEDVNGNGRRDFADVVLYFNAMGWIPEYEPPSAFDYNRNSRIDFADVVWLFNHL